MILNININTADPLDDHDKVILLALAGEISLGEATDAPARSERTLAQAREEMLSQTNAKPTLDAITEVAEEVQEAVETAVEAVEDTPEEPKKRARVVNVSDASLKKYDFHRTDDGEIVCDHCDHVSETGRALHLHAGTHKDEAPAQEKALKAVPEPKDEPEAGVAAFTSTEPDKQDVADAEKAAAGDPDPAPVADVPAPVEAKVVDPKVLRDEVARVATEMVAASKQSDIRGVLDDLGVARVSMIAEKDLQAFLDAEPIAAFIASKKG